ncbi:MAG: exodeoxyribonuclease V subunit alpha [Balneolaceae bacterium]|nr:exodeoxyribonuclease V subunit alpha [Balneolaceae bacterium]
MSEGMDRLATARDREAISEISFQFCDFLSRTDPKCPAEVLLAGCLASERKGEGDVCVELEREAGKTHFTGGGHSGWRAPELAEWVATCRSSHCVGEPGEDRPLILDAGNRLYLQKYWEYERALADRLVSMADMEEMEAEMDPVRMGERLDALFGPETSDTGTDWQKVAAFTACTKKLTVISGGPGTGKTHTVANILVLLAGSGIAKRIALSAPTGKAAARLKQSVMSSMEEMQPEPAVRELIPDEAFTVHKLLGARRRNSGFRYGEDNPLPYDLVVVDEVSMVDLAMMYRLAVALPRRGRLILLGDKDQLASVEAGAVLGSICAREHNRFTPAFTEWAGESGLEIPQAHIDRNPGPLTDHIVLLKKSYRFDSESGIGRLSAAILQGDPDAAVELLRSDSYPDTELREFSDLDGLKKVLNGFVRGYFEPPGSGSDVGAAIDRLSKFVLLCVHRRGPLGAVQINALVEQLLRRERRIPPADDWYVGKPVVATGNDYTLGLRNGDLGITLRDEEGDLKVYFRKEKEDAGAGYLSYYPSRLTHIDTAYAMTVHKSQGSEFDRVGLILPGRVSRISTRELLYTAITRARENVTVVGSPDVVRGTIAQRAVRSSGLQELLWSDAGT